MKMILKLILTCIACLLSISLLYVLFAIVYPWVTEFNPAEKELLSESHTQDNQLSTDREYTLLTWNMGYAGLGLEMDFFYEGGKMVRPEKDQNKKYLDGIINFLKSNDSIDFIFLQEVDFRSKRTYKINQYTAIQEHLSTYKSSSATNYKSAFVPSPFFEPMGKVDAGMATFTKTLPASSCRLATPGTYAWPMRLYQLKRCLLVSRFPLENQKEMVLINIHNSAFNDASTLREKELEFLKTLILKEFKKGNYVVAGGDWNQNPPGWNPQQEGKYLMKPLWPINPEYLDNSWSWAFDPSLPTNRDVNEPFSQHSTPVTLLDFFATSPNVEIIHTKTIDLGFKDSDHLPVIMTFRLLNW